MKLMIVLINVNKYHGYRNIINKTHTFLSYYFQIKNICDYIKALSLTKAHAYPCVNQRNKSLFSKRKTKSSSFQYFLGIIFWWLYKNCVFSSRLPLSYSQHKQRTKHDNDEKMLDIKIICKYNKKKTKSRTQQNHNIKCVNISKKERIQYKRAGYQVMCAESISFCILRNFLHLCSIIIPMDWKLYILYHRCNHLWIMIWFFSNFQRQYFTNVTVFR